MTEFSELPPAERIKRYRVLAKDARREAQRVTGVMRQSYSLMAEQWDHLADEAEVLFKKSKGGQT